MFLHLFVEQSKSTLTMDVTVLADDSETAIKISHVHRGYRGSCGNFNQQRGKRFSLSDLPIIIQGPNSHGGIGLGPSLVLICARDTVMSQSVTVLFFLVAAWLC